MVSTEKNSFQLKPEHFVTGLTSRDFSDYAGFDLSVLALDPGASLLCEKLDRLESLGDADSKGFSKKGAQDDPRFLEKVAEEMAGFYLTGSSREITTSVKTALDPYQHYRNIQKKGPAAIDDKLRFVLADDLSSSRFGVFPGLLCEKVSVGPLSVSHSEIVVFAPKYNTSADFWAEATELPPDYIKNCPDQEVSRLLNALHEMRHTVQVLPDKEQKIFLYYAEMDADLFAHQKMRATGRGDDVLTGDSHGRYMGLLTSSRESWYAASLEALEQKRTPLDFYQAGVAVEEIRFRLSNKALGSLTKTNWRGQYDEAAYLNWADKALLTKPDKGYSLLKKMACAGVFSTKTAQQMAEKIVLAAEYFNPLLTRTTSARIKTPISTRPCVG